MHAANLHMTQALFPTPPPPIAPDQRFAAPNQGRSHEQEHLTDTLQENSVKALQS